MTFSYFAFAKTKSHIQLFGTKNIIMKKVVRIGKIEDQDKFRRDDIRKMSPNARVSMLINMQRKFFDWDVNPNIQRTATVTRMKKV